MIQLIETHLDLDFLIKDSAGNIGVVSTGGGTYPKGIISGMQEYEKVFGFLDSLEIIDQTPQVNPKLKGIKYFQTTKEESQYLDAFSSLAMRGIVVFDRSNINQVGDAAFHLVFRPRELISFSSLPQWLEKNMVTLNQKKRLNLIASFQYSDLYVPER